MNFPDHGFSILASMLGLVIGALFAVVLGLAGHGWASLLAVPATPAAMVLIIKLVIGWDA